MTSTNDSSSARGPKKIGATPRTPPDGEAASVAKSRRAQLRFVLIFAALAGTLSVAYTFPYEANGAVDVLFRAYLGAYASAAGAIVHLFDPTVRTSGQNIVGRFSIQIVRDCDAMEVNILYAAAVLAFSATWKRKLAGLVAGLGAISIANVLRLCTMYLVGVHWPSTFDFVHRELWPLLMVAVSSAAFLVWANRTGQEWPGVKRAAS